MFSQAMRSLRQYSAPWYTGYGFQGAVILGLFPIALPLFVGLKQGPVAAGWAVAVFYLSQFIAPFLGVMIDRFRCHRLVYLMSYVLIGVGCLTFPITQALWLWLVLSIVIGFGVAAGNTVVNLYIVDVHSQSQWDQRIGWLQTFYGTGQAFGLLLVALFGTHADWALYSSALLMLPGVYFGFKQLPDRTQLKLTHQSLHHHHTETHSIRSLHVLRFRHLCHLIKSIETRFSFYILATFFIMLSVWLIFNLYPLLMLKLYDINAHLSSLYYAIGAGIGIVAYAYSGILAAKIGDKPVLLVGIIMTVISWTGMSFFAFVHTAQNNIWVPIFFILTPIAWSPLIVIGTSMTPKLSRLSSGECIGIFNATVAIASFVGALLAGYIADSLGYGFVVIAALVSILIGLMCIGVLKS